MVGIATSAQQIIDTHNLIRHDEGGWFRETYRSSDIVECTDRTGLTRSRLTTIHYMLENTKPRGLFHRNKSDIVHFYEGGGTLRYLTVTPEGIMEETLLGGGYERQLIVKGGTWKASELINGEWGMVGEAVAPGFDYRDRDLADRNVLVELHPQIKDLPSDFFASM